VHELNRGVFVRVLGADDITDIYLLRQIIEGSALRTAAAAEEVDLTALVQTVDDAELAAAEGRWTDLATLDLQFHHDIVALAGSPRLDEIARRLFAELRLAFHLMTGTDTSSRDFHEPYLVRNRKLATLLQKNRFDLARRELGDYLDDALAQILAAATPTDGLAGRK